jgi:5,10-methylenetetrahydromethanopterin reductase
MALAQQAATTQALCGGRWTLGVGVSHRPVIEGLLGLQYTSPAAHVREYLSVLVPLLTDSQVSLRGKYNRVDGGFVIPGTSRVPVLVGALSPRMVQAAGELADGVVTWLAGPRTLEEAIGPVVRSAATDSGRPPPRLVAAVPVAVCDDRAAGIARADEVFARYAGLPNYQRLMAGEGITSPGQLAVVGTESDVTSQLGGYSSAGVTELWAVVFPVGPDPTASRRRTHALLKEHAPLL